jgi:hypothetical protein
MHRGRFESMPNDKPRTVAAATVRATHPPKSANSNGRIGAAPRGGEGHLIPPWSSGGYFHSHNLECVFPWASTSNSKIAATVLRRANFGEAEL